MSDKLKYPVITIGREYCAYGRTVAAALADSLGIKYYDKDFVQKTVKESGFTEDEVRDESETISGMSKFWDDVMGITASYKSSYDRIFEAQTGVILELAKEPCILVGRCANFILRNAGIDSLNVLLTADMEFRMKRAAELNPDVDGPHLEKLVRKIDYGRDIYYHKYTGMGLTDPHNYDICLDIGRLGVDKTVETILNICAAG